MMYKCWGCSEEFNRRDGAWFCRSCRPKQARGEFKIEIFASSNPDRAYEGWNEGLGVHVQDKKHYDYLAQSQGLTNIPDSGHAKEIAVKAKETKKQKDLATLTKAYKQAVKQ